MHGQLQKPSTATAGRSSSAKRISREKPCWTSRQCRPTRAGFTLVELLITITIIGLLSAVVLGALQAARETAKVSKTKATITKLHYLIMERYDSYRTRRVPVDVKAYVANHDGDSSTGANEGAPFYSGYSGRPLAYAHARLMVIRDLMRMEMPDRGSDLYGMKVPPGADILTPIPSIAKRYQRLFAGKGADEPELDMPSAEYLYMIVMSNSDDAEKFSNTEIGDYDGDGLPEFIDGWGRPIKFLRWPVGFLPDGSGSVIHGAVTDLHDVNNPDPFDPLGVAGNGFAVFPLIYSAGPDGVYDINTGYKADGSGYEYFLDAITGTLNPYNPNPPEGDGYLIGQPLHRENGVAEAPDPANLHHYDNIHNHILEVR